MGKREIILEILEAWLKDEDWRVRQAAMNACQGQEVPLELIAEQLFDR